MEANKEGIKEVLEIIKRTRKTKNISQEEMARKLGINRSAYGRFEDGKSLIHLDRLIKVCRILMISTSWVLDKAIEDKYPYKEDLESRIKDFQKIFKILHYNVNETFGKFMQYNRNELTIDEMNKQFNILLDLLEVLQSHVFFEEDQENK